MLINSDDAKIINGRFSVIAAISNKKVIDFTVVKKGFILSSHTFYTFGIKSDVNLSTCLDLLHFSTYGTKIK